MTIIEAQDLVTNKLQIALNSYRLLFLDNIVILPAAFPFCAIDPVESVTAVYAGGSMPPERHVFDIYLVESIANHRNSIRDTRIRVAKIISAILGIPRFYAKNNVHYGEDVVGSARVCFARVSITYPV
ncbi:MAG: hypothetical protein Q8M98_05210 [Candidatus Cloacimonadaceae bacterium]|nr:hypothetical protein [Candidatus Cloacimonadaceae bacterium]